MKEKISQKLKIYKENDEREKLWNLAFELAEQDMKDEISEIANYYIEKNDGFYICELISTSIEYLEMNAIIEKIIATKNKDFIRYVMINNTIRYDIEKYYNKLNKALN